MSETVNLQVGFSADDADETEAGADVITSLTTVLKGGAGGAFKHHYGVRFRTVEIPRWAFITSATLSLWITVGTTPMNVTVNGLKGNQAEFNTTAKDLSSRATVKQAVAWGATPTVGAFNESPSLSSLIQEIVHSEEWTQGNNLALRVSTEASTSFTIQNWDGKPEKAAKLAVTFEPVVFQPLIVSQAVMRGTLR